MTVQYATRSGAATVVGDLNLDGQLDLAVWLLANSSALPSHLAIYYGVEDGGFVPQPLLTLPSTNLGVPAMTPKRQSRTSGGWLFSALHLQLVSTKAPNTPKAMPKMARIRGPPTVVHPDRGGRCRRLQSLAVGPSADR